MLRLSPANLLELAAELILLLAVGGKAGSSLLAAALDIFATTLLGLDEVPTALELDRSKLFALNCRVVVDGC